MRLFFVTYLLPAHVPSTEATGLDASVASLLHALRPPPMTPEVGANSPLCGTVVQLAQDPAWLLDQLIAISPELRVLIVPRDDSQPCLAHPPDLLSRLHINRADWDVTCVRFAQAAAH